jgi:hypothetical protein
MSATTPDLVIEGLEDKLAALTLGGAVDIVQESDKLTCVIGPEELVAREIDRTFCVLLTGGPDIPRGSSRCTEVIRCQVHVRYFLGRESRARMLRDVPEIREALRTLSSVTGVRSPTTVDAVIYDYGTLQGDNTVVVVFPTTITYDIEVS